MLKKIWKIVICIAIIFPVFSLAEEKINNFDTIVQVNEDATINVTENITWDFDNLQSGKELHGLYRDIPFKYRADYGAYNFDFSNISVNTDNFEYYNYGKYLRIDTNPDPFIHVSGVKTYSFNYKVGWAIGYFSDFDEIYWNATGDEWSVPINNASAKVILPKPLPESQLRISCYEGLRGSKESCPHTLFTNNGLVESVAFSSARRFGPHEGVTIAVGFPKGIVYEPTFFEKTTKAIGENSIFMLPVLVFFVMLFVWYKKGRDPKGTGVIIPQYDVPEGLTPMEVGIIVNEFGKNSDLSAEIIQLAIRGYLKIRKTASDDYVLEKMKDDLSLLSNHQGELMESLFGNNELIKKTNVIEQYEKGKGLEDKGKFDQYKKKISKFIVYLIPILLVITLLTLGLTSYLPKSVQFVPIAIFMIVMGAVWLIPILFIAFIFVSVIFAIFKGDAKVIVGNNVYGDKTIGSEPSLVLPKKEIRLSLLMEKFYAKAAEIQNTAIESVVSKDYYFEKPSKSLWKYMWISFLVIVVVFFGGETLYNYYGLSMIISLVLSSIIIGIFARYMPKKTEKGIATYEYILGLKDYLQIAEKDRINFHNAPEKRPEIFEKFLPYAMVLGVEKAWAKEFQDIYTTPPSWYSDVHGGTFSAMAFTSSLNSFSSSAGSTLTSAPGGSSGSGGGGSSGGGGGGGGGGSH